jgi:hypothetical protein
LEDLNFLARYLVMERQLVATGKPLISTEPRLAWRRVLEAALAENYDAVVPHEIYGKSSWPWRRLPTSACAYSMRSMR